MRYNGKNYAKATAYNGERGFVCQVDRFDWHVLTEDETEEMTFDNRDDCFAWLAGDI